MGVYLGPLEPIDDLEAYEKTMQTSTIYGASSFNPFPKSVVLNIVRSREPFQFYIMERNMARARYEFSHWVEGGALYIFNKVLPK